MLPSDRIEQIDAMRAGVDYNFVIRLRDFALAVRPITVAENLRITGDVMAELLKMPEAGRSSAKESNLLATHMLIQASTSGPDKNDPKITAYIVERMTPDELQHLYMEWVDGCKKCSPTIEHVDDKELMELADMVKKNPETVTQLSRSRLSALVQFFLTLNG